MSSIRVVGTLISWVGRPIFCKFGHHDWIKASEGHTLKLVCLRCPAETPGIDIIHQKRHQVAARLRT